MCLLFRIRRLAWRLVWPRRRRSRATRPSAAVAEEEAAPPAEESAPAPQAEPEAPAAEATLPEASVFVVVRYD
jgi:hypothetical protein